MLVIVKLQKFINNLYKSTTYYVNKLMKGVPGGALPPPGFGLSFLLVHPLLRRVAGAPVSHCFMASLNLVKIFNCFTKYKILWLLLEMILNRSLAGYLNCSVAEIYGDDDDIIQH